jgi:hypothetical protein
MKTTIKTMKLINWIMASEFMRHLVPEQRAFISVIIRKIEKETPGRFQPLNCFLNAMALALRGEPRISYMQGTLLHNGEKPIAHGWNLIDGIRFDVTTPINLFAGFGYHPEIHSFKLAHIMTYEGREISHDRVWKYVEAGGCCDKENCNHVPDL